jgi:D-alanyl-D-alanine carboxypeptidase (penicillin-binding protein 5/6)
LIADRFGGGSRLRRLFIGLAVALSLAASPAAPARAASPPVISAPEAIIVDGWSGAVLWSKNADTPRYPASTVKVMTALLVLEHHLPMPRVETVSPYAASYAGSTAGLYAGERMTVWNLMHGMLLPSGNDAAVTLAEAVAGSAVKFVGMMNAEAARLHLWHTHYLTPNGFDAWGQVTTARDLARLSRVAMHHALFARIVRTRAWTAWSADHRIVHHWTNLNKLLWSHATVNGVKTGTTPGAGACLVSSAVLGNRWVIAVNMGSSAAARFTDGAALLNYGLIEDSSPPNTH